MVILLSLLDPALARPPHYNDDELRLAEARPRRDDLLAMANRVQKQRGVRFVHGGQDAKVGALPDEALGAIWVASEDGRAVHYDLRMPDARGVLRPVSVRLDGEVWTITTRTGPAPQPVDPGRLQAALGSAGLVVRPGGRPWEAHVAEAIVRALARLTPAERAALKGVGIARQPGRGAEGDKAATYHTDGSWIALYDPAAASAQRFVGSPNDPYPPTSLVFLHEVAHAIADRPLRGIVQEHEQRRLAAMKEQEALKRDIERHNAELARYRARPSDAEAERLRLQEASLGARRDQIGAEVAQLNAAVTSMSSGGKERITPMGAAYRREVGHPVTRYGETSADEAFAEAFALYHLDPEALEQVAPGALAWFRTGRHLADP